MSFASRIITALVGLGLIVFFWPFGSGEETVTAVEQRPSKQLFTKPIAPAPNNGAAKARRPAKVGAAGKVTPAGKADAADKSAHAVPVAEEPKPKAEGAKPDGEQIVTLSFDKLTIDPSLKPKLFYRVVVRDGGTLEAGGTVITLGSIAARKATAQCKDADGKAWACGARARVAMMRLIHGRAVTCQVPKSGKQTSLTARCTVGGSDLSTWMVVQGWAEPKALSEQALADAAAAARKKRIGIWR